jgi:hypothetical protein
MPLTHEQAQELIQLNMDKVLNADESTALSSHCAVAATAKLCEMNEVERLLPQVMKASGN